MVRLARNDLQVFHRKEFTGMIITDGGKPANLNENNYDCTVRALAIAGGIDYEVAYIIAEDAGRMPAKSYPWAQVVREWMNQGFGTYDWNIGNGTVASFIRNNPRGRFVLRVYTYGAKSGHVFAVIDGVIYDNSPVSTRQEVRSFYALKPKK